MNTHNLREPNTKCSISKFKNRQFEYFTNKESRTSNLQIQIAKKKTLEYLKFDPIH